ncbi:hypothetical protein MNJPNG_27635 [Cupriavidus oxalaticus]
MMCRSRAGWPRYAARNFGLPGKGSTICCIVAGAGAGSHPGLDRHSGRLAAPPRTQNLWRSPTPKLFPVPAVLSLS